MERQLHAGEALPVLGLLGVQFRGQLCRAKGIGEQAACHQFTGQRVAAGCGRFILGQSVFLCFTGMMGVDGESKHQQDDHAPGCCQRGVAS